MKYYLLKYNENYADEIDIPALACFTEEEYNTWLELPVGTLNSKYEEEFKKYSDYLEAYDELGKRKKTILGENWQSVKIEDWPTDLINDYNNLSKKFGYYGYYIEKPNKIADCYIRAYLGNWDEGFDESFMYYAYMKELVEDKSVIVSEVSEEFFKIFHENGLSRLSLCNIFDIYSILECKERKEYRKNN